MLIVNMLTTFTQAIKGFSANTITFKKKQNKNKGALASSLSQLVVRMCTILGLKMLRLKYKMTQLSKMGVFQHRCVIAAGEEKYILWA